MERCVFGKATRLCVQHWFFWHLLKLCSLPFWGRVVFSFEPISFFSESFFGVLASFSLFHQEEVTHLGSHQNRREDDSGKWTAWERLQLGGKEGGWHRRRRRDKHHQGCLMKHQGIILFYIYVKLYTVNVSIYALSICNPLMYICAYYGN